MNRTKRFGLLLALSLGIALIVVVSLSAYQTRAQAQVPSGWEVYNYPNGMTVYGLDMIDATAGWAGGAAGFMYSFNGTDWGGVPTAFDRAIYAIDMIDSSEGWGVGYLGIIIHYDGTNWQEFDDKDVTALHDVQMINDSFGWAVGNVGTILVYSGGTWQPVTSPTTNHLQAIDMLHAGDGWIVGESGAVLRWNGSAWSFRTVITGGLGFSDVDAVSSTDVWAVGDKGMIYHYGGGAGDWAANWVQVASPISESITAIDMINSGDGWAVAEGGHILRWNGSEWLTVTSPTTYDMFALDMIDVEEGVVGEVEDGWASGKAAKILRYTGEPALPPDLSTSTKAVSLRQADEGERLTYTIQVSNTGESPAAPVAVTDTLDLSRMTYVPGSATASKGTVQEPAPDSLVVTIDEIAAQETVTITFQVTVGTQISDCWFLSNEAILATGGISETRRALTSIGDCHQFFLPITLKNFD